MQETHEKEHCGLTFTQTQNRLITCSLTLLAVMVLVAGISLAGLYTLKVLGYFIHIIGPVIVAFFLSLLTRPWYQKIFHWTGNQKVVSVVLFSLSFLIPITLLGWVLGAFLVEQWVGLSASLPELLSRLYEKVNVSHPEVGRLLFTILPNPEAIDSTNILTLVAYVLGAGAELGSTLFSVGTATLLWLLTFFYWIIFVMLPPLTGEAVASICPFLSAKNRASLAIYFRDFTEIMESYFRGQTIDVIIQGLLYGVTFQVVGLPNGFIIGFVVGLLNLMPYLGVITGICITLPLALVHGGVGFMVLIFLVFCVIQTYDGYVMQPYIQGKRMRLSAWQIVFALLFWTKVGGFLGLLLAIPVTAFIKASWRKWRDGADRFVLEEPETKSKGAEKGAHV
jgi:predicted PurR-regulated permease PerM